MTIFNSYVSLPEGRNEDHEDTPARMAYWWRIQWGPGPWAQRQHLNAFRLCWDWGHVPGLDSARGFQRCQKPTMTGDGFYQTLMVMTWGWFMIGFTTKEIYIYIYILNIILCYIILYCIKSYYILYHIILYYAMLYQIKSYYILLNYVLYYIIYNDP